MARLNEVPPPPQESIESLKRRYARQNREIVRTNTAQSARIRNLECEVTRLLNENLAWREEAIAAKAEAEKWKAAHRLNKEVLRMKEQLEAKLSEVNLLVGELGALPEKVARRSSQKRRRDGFVSELVKPDEREPRHRQTMLEQEGRLPAILEDKYYPRRTIELNEIEILKDGFDDATESPDVGPPPVAHFDEAEAVMFDAGKSPRRTSTELIEESERACKPSVTIVESRRKRRTSSLLSNADFKGAEHEPEAVNRDAMEVEQQKQQEPVPLPSILKKGAKRKIEASELEDTSNISKELDEFIFQRKLQNSTTPAAKPSRFSRPTVRDQPTQDQSIEPPRRALAPKSTNSPAKRKLAEYAGGNDEKQDLKPTEPTRRVVSRIRTRPAATVPSNEERPPLQEQSLHPDTPAPDFEDALSPVSAEPQQHHKLPKEAAITNSVEDVLNGSIGRGSRRARAAVSYAEPNLRDKMRRPGKELVSAVEGLSRQNHESDASRSRSEEVQSKTQEPDTNSRVHEPSEPASPTLRKPSHALHSAIDHVESSVFDPPRSSSPTEDEQLKSRPRQSLSVLKTRRHSVQTGGEAALRVRRPNSVSEVPGEIKARDGNKGHVRKTASTTTLPSARSMQNVHDQGQHSDRGSDSETQRLPRGGLSRRRSLMV